MTLRAAITLAIAFATTGCRGCHDGHPYVPYAVDTAQPAARAVDRGLPPALASANPADSGRVAFADEPAVVAPAGLALWTVDGVALQAPEGWVFVSALVRDFDDDGAKDAFALVRGGDGGDGSALAYYRGRRDAESLQEPKIVSPVEAAHEATCARVDRLAALGKRSVLVELGAVCSADASNSPDRWVAVFSAGAEPKVRLAWTIADPPGAGALSVDGDVVDRDGDGLEDLALRVTLEGGVPPAEPGPRVSVVFAWLDRSAGLSRDLAPTESSFASMTATAATRATRPKDAPAVPILAAQVRALWRAACAEGGAPRVVGLAGTGAMACGAAHALEGIGLAEVRAYATTGDSLRAALALDRVERSPGSRAGPRLSEAQRWVAQVAPVANARALRSVAAVPVVGAGREPAWGPLAFEASGRLLVRTQAGVVRVDPDAGDEAAAEGLADWKSAVTAPDGIMRWIETYDPCDGLALHASFAPAGGDDLRDLALPVAPPIGGHCAGSRGAPARTLPIAWGAGGIEAIVEGEPVLISPDLAHASALARFLHQPPPPGAPRSPDANALVIATGAGLFVYGTEHGRLFRAPELDGTYAEQRDCVVDNGATHVACVRAGKVWVGTWAGP